MLYLSVEIPPRGRSATAHRLKRHVLRVAACAALLTGSVPHAWAQYLSPSPLGTVNPIIAPSREYTGLPIGAWMLYPEVGVGAVYDSNVFQSPVNPVSALGVRLAPSLIADLNNGIHRTTLYGSMNARFYPDASEGNAVDGRAGVIQVYEVMRDLVFRAQGDYSRQTNVFATGIQVTGTEPIVSPLGTTMANPSNQFTGSLSVEKTFGSALFVAVRGSTVRTVYDNNLPSSDSTINTLATRFGYWLTPDLNLFVEPSFDSRNYDNSPLSSSGYKVVGGVASRQIGLFRGELYAGWGNERLDTASAADLPSSVFGGRIYYEPTRYWKLNLAINRSLDATPQPILLSPLGAPVRATAAVLQSEYNLSQQWSATARLGYAKYEYVDSSSNAWLAGGRIVYKVWQNMALSLEYEFTDFASNVPLTSYSRSVITAGILYKY